MRTMNCWRSTEQVGAVTECEIPDCDNQATREKYHEQLERWIPYCDDCTPAAVFEEERPIDDQCDHKEGESAD